MTHISAKPIFAMTEAESVPSATTVAPTSGNPAKTSSEGQAATSNGDRILFEIAPGWGIGFDSLQWMLMRQRQGQVRGWYPVAFVASERRILERVIREKAVPVTAEGRARLEALPPTFKVWKVAKSANAVDIRP